MGKHSRPGVALANKRRAGANHPNWWRGNEVGYFGMHSRLGSPKQGTCVDCDNDAMEWSLQPDVPSEHLLWQVLRGRTKPTAYSLIASDYARRCTPCHRSLDNGKS